MAFLFRIFIKSFHVLNKYTHTHTCRSFAQHQKCRLALDYRILQMTNASPANHSQNPRARVAHTRTPHQAVILLTFRVLLRRGRMHEMTFNKHIEYTHMCTNSNMHTNTWIYIQRITPQSTTIYRVLCLCLAFRTAATAMKSGNEI